MANIANAGFDAASNNATRAVETAANRVSTLIADMENLIKDLADPKLGAQAQARLQLLQMQVSMVTNVMNAVKDLMKSFFQR